MRSPSPKPSDWAKSQPSSQPWAGPCGLGKPCCCRCSLAWMRETPATHAHRVPETPPLLSKVNPPPLVKTPTFWERDKTPSLQWSLMRLAFASREKTPGPRNDPSFVGIEIIITNPCAATVGMARRSTTGDVCGDGFGVVICTDELHVCLHTSCYVEGR